MNIKTKKVIAREFLILLFCIAIGILTFLCIYPYNYFRRIQIDNLTESFLEKRIISDSLSKPYKEKLQKQIWFTTELTKRYNLRNPKNTTNASIWETLYKIAKNDSIKYKWENTWEKDIIAFQKDIGLGTPGIFKDFILTNIIYQKEIEQNNAAKLINSEIYAIQDQISELKEKVISKKYQLQTAELGFIISVLIFFPFRYIFYGIKWSVKTLKQSH